MVRLIVIAALLAACGPKSNQPAGDPEPTGDGDDDSGETGDSNLATVAPELDALDTEISSVRDLPSEERDLELCEGADSLLRMIGDLSGRAPEGVDGDTWEATVDELRENMVGVQKGCPDKLDDIDASFTAFLDALDGLVEAASSYGTAPAPE